MSLTRHSRELFGSVMIDVCQGKTTGVEEGEFRRGGLGIGGDDWDLGMSTGDWTETRGYLEGGTGGWSGTKGNLGRRPGDWNEIRGDFEGRRGDWNGKHADLARESGNLKGKQEDLARERRD